MSGKRYAPCTAPELCVATLSGKRNRHAPSTGPELCVATVRNFGLCQEKEIGMPHPLDLSCV